jgi:hypothetical protein
MTSLHIIAKSASAWLFGSIERDRLVGEISRAWIEFDDLILRESENGITEPWARCVVRNLLEAESSVLHWDLQQGWMALNAALRSLLERPGADEEVEAKALTLRREMVKMSGWRVKAIADLLGDHNSKPTKASVIHALALRDDQSATNYFKIMLRRRHLISLFAFMSLGLLICLLLSSLNLLSPFLSNTQEIAAVFLFGILGASVSVAQSLLAQDVTAKVPEQQIGAFVVWMRPIIGGVAALLAAALLKAKPLGLDIHGAGILPVAFAAGFSERFIVGAVGKIGLGDG